jgi:Mg-chelatase subunit ChlD
MITFQKARQRHGAVDTAAHENEHAAGELWAATSGVGEGFSSGSYAEAVADVWPADLAAILADDSAVAYAFEILGDVYRERTYNGYGVKPPAPSPIDLRDWAREGWGRIRKRIEEAEKISTGTGWDLSAAFPHLKNVPDNSQQLEKLRKIAALAGRMFQALRGAKSKKSPDVAEEYHGREQGAALTRLVPSERMLLGDDVAEWLLFERLARRKAEQYSVRGPAKLGRGPLVMVIDESGSMNHDRNVWAKAAMMALSRAAGDEKRPVSVVHFSVGTKPVELKPGDIKAQIDAMLHFYGGGTDTQRALAVGREQVKLLETKGHRGADVILITDGEEPVERYSGLQAQTDALAAENIRLWTIAIECVIPEKHPVRAAAAKYVGLTHAAMNDPNALTAVVDAL